MPGDDIYVPHWQRMDEARAEQAESAIERVYEEARACALDILLNLPDVEPAGEDEPEQLDMRAYDLTKAYTWWLGNEGKTDDIVSRNEFAKEAAEEAAQVYADDGRRIDGRW